MKVCSYIRNTALGKFTRLGVLLDDETIVDVNLVWRAHYEDKKLYNVVDKANSIAPYLLSDFLETSNNPIDKLKETLFFHENFISRGINETSEGALLSFNLSEDDDVALGNPMDKINCYRDFYTHEKHVEVGFKKRGEQIPAAWYEIPAYYKGPTTGFLGTGQEIPWPSYTDILDYELEMAVIIGKDGKNILEQNALKHVFGVSVLNDISARDIQKKEMAVRLGPAKGKDFCSILGPVITTIDEFGGEIPSLLMQATVNGEKWSEGQSGDANFSWEEMIAHASKEEWLLTTDVLGSGTVGTGCGLELDKWIQPGDDLELYIEHIGILKNKVGNKNT